MSRRPPWDPVFREAPYQNAGGFLAVEAGPACFQSWPDWTLQPQRGARTWVAAPTPAHAVSKYLERRVADRPGLVWVWIQAADGRSFDRVFTTGTEGTIDDDR